MNQHLTIPTISLPGALKPPLHHLLPSSPPLSLPPARTRTCQQNYHVFSLLWDPALPISFSYLHLSPSHLLSWARSLSFKLWFGAVSRFPHFCRVSFLPRSLSTLFACWHIVVPGLPHYIPNIPPYIAGHAFFLLRLPTIHLVMLIM